MSDRLEGVAPEDLGARTRPAGPESPERREFLGACARGAVAFGAGLALPGLLRAQDGAAGPEAAGPAPMRYAPRDFSALRGLDGLSDAQVELHLELYGGYVRRTNALLERLEAARAAGDTSAAAQELRRRLGWEWNGMRLHELYFENLQPAGGALPDDHPLAAAARATCESVEAWRAELVGTAKLPGSGWAIVSHDAASGQLITSWVEDHHDGHLAGARPVLVLDLWEHAWTVDRKPTERAAYLDAVLRNVSWAVVARRMGA